MNVRKNRKKANPDMKYNDYTVQRMIQYIMEEGKKTIAEKIVYKAIDILKADDSVPQDLTVNDVIKKIMQNVRPSVEVVSRRVRGATYPVPCEVKPRRGEMLALRWLIQGADKRVGNMDIALAKEMVEAFNGVGYAVKQKDQTHAAARGSRAFAHFGGARS